LSNQLAVERVAEVEARSAGLRKELGLVDLVLMQIMYVVGSAWVGTAAKLGSSHTVFWLLAILLYYLPQAAVVIFLARLMPLEGGLYQWAKLGLSELLGFLVAWNLWLFAILNTSEIGLQITQYLRYIVGPRIDPLTNNPLFIAATSAVMIGALVFPEISSGYMEQSITRRRSIPRTRKRSSSTA